MGKDVLIKTNLLVCLIISLGFIGAAYITYQANIHAHMKSIEDISNLSSESIYYRLESLFARPISVSTTMANDSLLGDFLADETERLSDPQYIETLRRYLDGYREIYQYDSVFLVSTKSRRYYNFKGVDRILTDDNPENDWYFRFLKSNEECSLEVDNDEAAENEITVFVNCRIKDESGNTRGVVGVGMRIDYLQTLLEKYELEFGVEAYLINEEGIIELTNDQHGYERVNHFEISGYSHLKDEILSARDQRQTGFFWLNGANGQNYIVSRYVPDLSWHLIVEHNTNLLDRQMRRQLMETMLVGAVIVIASLLIITYVIRGYNKKIIEITAMRAAEKQAAFRKATEQLYESINEVNVTENTMVTKIDEQFLKNLGLPGRVSYEELLKVITEERVKEEFRSGVLEIFLPRSILRAFENGVTALNYEFPISYDGETYHWTKVAGYLYESQEDASVRMFSYHQNIDDQKRQEQRLAKEAQLDAMTGLYNKAATQQEIEKMLVGNKSAYYAFFIFDIDNFKNINDRGGHAVGDQAIKTFASLIKRSFRSDDVVGRIGGDEFVAFVPVPGRPWLEEKAASLVRALNSQYSDGDESYGFSASIGVAFYPEQGRDFESLYKNADAALYESKTRGKNRFTLFS